MIDQKLIELRKAMKARKPNFHVQNSNDPKKRFSGRWKRPKGLQSKIRERRKGNPRYIEPGYGSPAAVRGVSAEGLFPVVVHNVGDLAKVKGDHGVVISATVGLRKKAEIVKVAVEKKLRLLNVNHTELAKAVGEFLAARKKRRHEILQKRKIKGEAKKPAPEATSTAAAAKSEQAKAAGTQGQGAPDIESRVDDEDKKKAEKAEKDRILTKAK